MAKAVSGIYISIPFCAQKCTYCNFRSDVYAQTLRDSYMQGLTHEISQHGVQTEFETLYLGGGSPSLLAPEEFSALNRSIPSVDWKEGTIEVAPGETTPERVKAWVALGLNRVSFGVQSFVPAVASAAGRKHNAQTVQSDISCLKAHGIHNISVDLIAGLAYQTPDTWQQSLQWIERLDIDHVSVYMLETGDNSRLGRELRQNGNRYGAKHVPHEDQILELYLTALDHLLSLDFERYEVSNFARSGKRSLHNLKYWRMEPYIGFGSDAHSYDGQNRWSNVATAPEYTARFSRGESPRDSFETMSTKSQLEDRVITGLRTSDGVRLSQEQWNRIAPNVASLVERDWLLSEKLTLQLTGQGMLFADEAVAILLG